MAQNETSTFDPGSNIGLLASGAVTIAEGHAAGARIVKLVNLFNPTGNATTVVTLKRVKGTTSVTLKQFSLVAGADDHFNAGPIVLVGTDTLTLTVTGTPTAPIEWAVDSAVVAVPTA